MFWVFDLNEETGEVIRANQPQWLFLDDAIRYCATAEWPSAVYDEYGHIYYAQW